MGNIINIYDGNVYPNKYDINHKTNKVKNEKNFESLKWNLFGKKLFIYENSIDINVKRISSKLHYRLSTNYGNNNNNDKNSKKERDSIPSLLELKPREFEFSLNNGIENNDKKTLKFYKEIDKIYNPSLNINIAKDNDDKIFFMDYDMIYYAKKKNRIISPLWLSGLIIFLMPLVSFEHKNLFQSIFDSKLEYKNLLKYHNDISQFIKSHKENQCIENSSLWKEKPNGEEIHWKSEFLKWASESKKEIQLFEPLQKENNIIINNNNNNNNIRLNFFTNDKLKNILQIYPDKDLFYFMEKWIQIKLNGEFDMKLFWNKNEMNEYFSLESWFLLNQICFYKCYLLSKNCTTKLMPFYLSKKESITVSTLYIEKEIFQYYEDSEIQYVVIPCKNKEKGPLLECHFIISIDDKKEPNEWIDKIIDKDGSIQIPFEKKMGNVFVPLFKIEKQNENTWENIKSLLKIDIIDFSSIFSRENTNLEKIYEKISFQLSYLPPSSSFQFVSNKIKDQEKFSNFTININKPFLFLLYEPITRTIVFMAQVYYPK